jgi:hypothetical protein
LYLLAEERSLDLLRLRLFLERLLLRLLLLLPLLLLLLRLLLLERLRLLLLLRLRLLLPPSRRSLILFPSSLHAEIVQY